MPQSPELRVVTRPMPALRAFSMARSMARADMNMPRSRIAINKGGRRAVAQDVECSAETRDAGAEQLVHIGQKADPLRLVIAQVGVQQTIGKECGIVFVRPMRNCQSGIEIVQIGGGNAHWGILVSRKPQGWRGIWACKI